MLSDAIVLEIRRLLDEGRLSCRAIGRQVGVSRGVVGDVAKGRRTLRAVPMVETHSALPSRCRKCGGMVYKPCRLCRTRAYQEITRDGRRSPEGRPPSGPKTRRVA